MTRTPILAIALLCACASQPTPAPESAATQPATPAEPAAADRFTGRWAGDMSRPDGGKRHWDIVLAPEGAGAVKGTVFSPSGEAPITGGTVAGDVLTFTSRGSTYKGQILEEKILFTVTGARGASQTVMTSRVSRDPVPPPAPKITLPEVRALPANGLAQKPPMGWNSWNKFHTKIDDKLVREIADAMVSSGMQKAGYTYVNIDDGWEGERDAEGNIRPNARFPDMKALADYVHGKGLKLGIYSSPGTRTCAGFEGSLNHEAQDAKSYATWGIDYLKYDWCTAALVYKPEQMRAAYQKMGEALAAAGRPIVYSLCQYGREHVEQWGAAVGGNLWRTTGDISDAWDKMANIGFDRQKGLDTAAGPGHWNDPDMLEIGNGGMTDEEYRTHMSLWAMLAAPLVAGNDLRTMTPAIRDILTEPEVIAIDQDSLGRQGKPVVKEGETEVWVRALDHDAHAVALFNRGAMPAKVTASFGDSGISGKYSIRSVWEHADKGVAAAEYSAEVPSHGVVLLRLEPGTGKRRPAKKK
jgi:alpha-galactosidase